MSSRDSWIDIKEQKPPKNSAVLVYVPERAFSAPLVTVAQFQYETDGMRINTYLGGHGFGGYEWDFDFTSEDVTHWKYLPQPPRKI